MKKLPAQPVNGLLDGIAVLQYLSIQEEPAGCRQIARDLGLCHVRVNRLLKTFEYLSFAHQNSKGKYSAGSGIHVLSAQFLGKSGLLKKAAFKLEGLIEENLTVALGMLWRDNVSYLYHHSPGMTLLDSITHITSYPATKSSVGMLLMAEQEDDYIAELYENKPIPGFENIGQLLQKISSIRDNGHFENQTEEVTSLAVKVGAPAYAAVAISGRFDAEMTPIYLQRLQEAAAFIDS